MAAPSRKARLSPIPSILMRFTRMCWRHSGSRHRAAAAMTRSSAAMPRASIRLISVCPLARLAPIAGASVRALTLASSSSSASMAPRSKRCFASRKPLWAARSPSRAWVPLRHSAPIRLPPTSITSISSPTAQRPAAPASTSPSRPPMSSAVSAPFRGRSSPIALTLPRCSPASPPPISAFRTAAAMILSSATLAATSST